MCGIAGAYGLTDDDILNEMLGCIRHRGPDEEGYFFDTDSSLMMGARRLSIIDLAEGSQPIFNEDGSVAVVFNGEIYNYETIKTDLESCGHQFNTDCDTEVLVHLWEEYGESMPEHLNGMFAFSIWDSDSEELFLARDRLGIKPLYYSLGEEVSLWASEIQPLLAAGVDRSLDEKAVYNYFSLRYFPWPQTPFESIQKLSPGTSLLISEDGVTKQEYWNLQSNPTDGDFDDLATRLRSLLEESVQKRLMSDVPLGAFLSGGLDSSSIVALMSEYQDTELDTFSIGFAHDEFDESSEAKFVADYFDTNHHQIDIDLDSMDLFGDVVEHCGEPLADPAVLPTLAISRYASQEVKVVLSGEGADEILGGYWYFDEIPRHQQMFNWLPKQSYQLARLIEPYIPRRKQTLRYFSALESTNTAICGVAQRFQVPVDRYLSINFTPEDSGLMNMIRSTQNYVEEDDFYKRMLAFDIKYWLPDDLLYKVDRTSMAASLEARVPFLDHSIVEFGYNVPVKYKQNAYKPLLKRAMKDLLPERTLQREKHGLGVPVGKWFRQDHEAITTWLQEDRIMETPYLKSDAVLNLWEKHRSGKDHGLTLWKIINFVAWYHKVVDEN